MVTRATTILRFFTVVAVAFIALILAGWIIRPDVHAAPPVYSPAVIAAAERARDVSFDPAHPPDLYVHKIVHPTAQSPILAELEHEGKLPPLAQRLPDEPVVLHGDNGIGNYGGTWLRIAPSLSDTYIIGFRLSGAFLFRWSPMGYPIEPHIARGATASPDSKIWTIELRPGLKWSDGYPFTADDILYWWEHEATDKVISGTPPPWMRIGGSLGRVEKVDTYHVRFIFDHPYPLFLEQLAQFSDANDSAAHYLKQFHPTIGDHALIQKDMQAYRLQNERAVYTFMKARDNPDCPRLWPWIYRKYNTGSPQVFIRNPYYYVVDPAGNQLPYIDRLQFDVQDPQIMAMNIANGDVSMQARAIRYSDYTEIMTRRAIAGTQVLHWYSAVDPYVINPNLNRAIDPKDSSSKWKAQYLSDKRFRQALSLAINRRAIIHADYNDQCVPSQVEPGPQSLYHSEKLANAFINYDPAAASKMLDAIGLNHRDEDGFRTFPDGSRMCFNFDYTDMTGSGPAQFIADDWGAVGVRIITRERSRALFAIEKDAGLQDFCVWTSESDIVPLVSPRYFVACNTECYYAPQWGRWFMRGGFYGDPDANNKGCLPVPHDSPMYESMTCYEKAIQTTDPAERKRLMDRITDIAADNLWSINVCSAPPAIVVLSKDIRNVPSKAIQGAIFSCPSNAGIETYFFQHPYASPGAVAEVRDSIIHPTGRPVLGSNESWGAVLLRISLGLLIVLGIGALGLRYPYVGRRLIIMIPTLAIISLIIFIIIQLPPGDFLTQKVAQIESSGDTNVTQQIDDLRALFHFDDARWLQYCRWTGLEWFVTWKGSDTGLLQGNLGRSMANSQPVNELVGDRLLFTIVLSAGTILLTWVIAIPIGVYSAVRRYTFTDHVLTLIGFIGMCVPAFLLALVLMAMAGVNGLFSPEFAAQPEWNWPKVDDLLNHLWLPVVVLGIGGTAAMIRVMRANLLDELRRPYVITAMAKGVRPMRRLIKYPLRMSLNPFISGIGGLLPALISGGAIVSIVLSLPTIGPLMLDALRDQDMYLAGSLLMLLNLLSVLGTLMSDLLLLWLDPRIRFGGAGR